MYTFVTAAMSLPEMEGKPVTEIGSMLFTRFVSGARYDVLHPVCKNMTLFKCLYIRKIGYSQTCAKKVRDSKIFWSCLYWVIELKSQDHNYKWFLFHSVKLL